VFVHGGVNTATAAEGCAAINRRARDEAKSVRSSDPNLDKTLTWSSTGPLWYRGLAGVEPAATDAELDATLKALGAGRIVIGHSVSATGRIRSLYGGRVIAIDTGMVGGEFYPGGTPSALEIDGETLTAIYPGKREPIGGLTWREDSGPRAARR
jgi:hypothetical protein